MKSIELLDRMIRTNEEIVRKNAELATLYLQIVRKKKQKKPASTSPPSTPPEDRFDSVTFPDLIIDYHLQNIEYDGKKTHLSQQVFIVFYYVERCGKKVEKENIICRCWDNGIGTAVKLRDIIHDINEKFQSINYPHFVETDTDNKEIICVV